MNNVVKISLLAVVLMMVGTLGAFNAKWIRDGIVPWWMTYFISAITASIWAYQARANIMPLTTAAVFQHFFFHASWYAAMVFLIKEHLSVTKIAGIIVAFIGMMIMSLG